MLAMQCKNYRGVNEQVLRLAFLYSLDSQSGVKKTDLYLITVLSLCVGIVMGNMKAICSKKIVGQIQSDLHICKLGMSQ